MFGTVKIGNKDVDMLANAATPYRYQMIFKEDFFGRVTGKVEVESRDFFAKIGYVMAMQAVKADMNKLNVDTFLVWLEGFEPADVFSAAGDIADIYNGTREGSSSPKEMSDQPSEK